MRSQLRSIPGSPSPALPCYQYTRSNKACVQASRLLWPAIGIPRGHPGPSTAQQGRPDLSATLAHFRPGPPALPECVRLLRAYREALTDPVEPTWILQV